MFVTAKNRIRKRTQQTFIKDEPICDKIKMTLRAYPALAR